MYGVLPYITMRRRLAIFALETVTPTPGKMEARKEVRMLRVDEERIRAAAAATGLQEADFIRQAALLRAQEVEQPVGLRSPRAQMDIGDKQGAKASLVAFTHHVCFHGQQLSEWHDAAMTGHAASATRSNVTSV